MGVQSMFCKSVAFFSLCKYVQYSVHNRDSSCQKCLKPETQELCPALGTHRKNQEREKLCVAGSLGFEWTEGGGGGGEERGGGGKREKMLD